MSFANKRKVGDTMAKLITVAVLGTAFFVIVIIDTVKKRNAMQNK